MKRAGIFPANFDEEDVKITDQENITSLEVKNQMTFQEKPNNREYLMQQVEACEEELRRRTDASL